MLTLSGRRIINLHKHISEIPLETEIIVGLRNLDQFTAKLSRIGFTANLYPGESVLPPTSFGPITRYNAEGKNLIHRDQPMEIAYRIVEWHWREFHGRGDYIERSDFKEVPYPRYPRTWQPPPSEELKIAQMTSGDKVLVASNVVYNVENEQKIRHTINLFLEIFGECEILSRGLDEIIQTRVSRLNWTILPQGRMPWNQLRQSLQPIIDRASKGNRAVIENRFKTFCDQIPDFCMIGRSGFDGYVIFGFTDRQLFVLESRFPGNATYIFDQNWETLSQLTKAEILGNHFQRDRIIHRQNWHERVAGLFG
jgi:hypothetical protein